MKIYSYYSNANSTGACNSVHVLDYMVYMTRSYDPAVSWTLNPTAQSLGVYIYVYNMTCLFVIGFCLVRPDPALYSFTNQGVLIVDSIDVVDQMEITDVS